MDPLGAWLEALAGARRVAPGEWGVRFEDVGGWPLDVGLRVADGLLRAQAYVASPGRWSPEAALRMNRSLVLVRLGATRSGELWATGEVVPEAAWAERLLATLVEVAQRARSGAA